MLRNIIAQWQRTAYVFEAPPAILDEIAEWLDTLPTALHNKTWKKVERKIPLSRRSFEDWKYLPRLEALPTNDGRHPLDIVLLRWKNYPLRVIVKNQMSRGVNSASWSVAGNKMELLSFQHPNPRQLYNSAGHELIHMTQYFMQEVLREAGIRAKPGVPGGQDHGRQKHKGPVVEQLLSHALDPSEFYPKLHTDFMAITDWIEDQEEPVDHDVLRRGLRWHMGLDSRPPRDLPRGLLSLLQALSLTGIFWPLKHHDPSLWRKAVSVFTRRMDEFLESLNE